MTALLTLGVSGAWAKVVNVDFTDGIFYQNYQKLTSYTERPASTTWCSCWESNGTPTVSLVAGSAWNILNDTYHATTYTITVPAGYHITGYSITPSALPNGSADLTHTGCAAKSFTVGEPNSIENLYVTTVSFSLSDQVTASAFTISVEQDDARDLAFYIYNVAGGYVNGSYGYSGTRSGAAKFKVSQGTGDNAGYYNILNCSTGQYVNFTGTANGTKNVLMNADAISENSYWTIKTEALSYYPGYNFITPKGGSGVSWNFFGGNKEGSIIGLWTSSENGYWKFVIEAPDFGDFAYTLVNDRNSLTTASADATSITTIASASLAYSASDTKQQFAFVYSSSGNCYLYNVGTNKFVNKDGSLSEYPSDAISFEESGNWDYPWVIKFDDSHYINIDGYNALKINNYGSGASYGYHDTEYDAGNMFKVLDRVAYDLSAAQAKLTANVTYQIIYNGENSISSVVNGTEIGATLSLPNVLKRGYVNYTFYSDAACTNEITTVPSAGNVTVYVNAVLDASCPITFSTEESPVWYVLQGKPGTTDSKNRNMYSDGTAVKGSLDGTFTTAHQWAFIGNPFSFKLKNGNGSYVTPSGTSGSNVALDETGADFGLFKNAVGSTNHIAMAVYDGTNQNVLNYHNGSATNMTSYVGTGATFSNGQISGLSSAFFYPYEYYQKAITDYMTMNDVLANMQKAGSLGYPAEDADASEALLATYVKIYGGQYTAEVLAELLANYPAYLEETDIVMPTDGKVYTFMNVHPNGEQYYINSSNGTMSVVSTETTPTQYICHKVTDNQFAFISLDDWYWMVAANKNGKEGSQAYDQFAPLTISQFYSNRNDGGTCNSATPENTFGLVEVIGKRTNNSAQNSVMIVTKGGDFDVSGGAFFSSSYSSAYKLTEVSDYYNKVNLTSDGTDAYASLYLPFAVTIPAGITAYAITDQNGKYATLNEIVTNGTLPKETAAILKKADQTTNETIYLSPATEAGSYSGGNLLDGTVETETLPSGSTYVLGNADGFIGLYPYTGTNLAKGKAYLNIPSSVKALYFNFGDADAIKSMSDNQTIQGLNEVFDLSGRQVSKPTRGLYIVNGKKVVVK